MSVVDRDYGHHNDDHDKRVATGLCVICCEDQALPDDEVCKDCGIEWELFEVVDISEESEL